MTALEIGLISYIILINIFVYITATFVKISHLEKIRVKIAFFLFFPITFPIFLIEQLKEEIK